MLKQFILEHPFLACHIIIMAAITAALSALVIFIADRLAAEANEPEPAKIKIKPNTLKNRVRLICFGDFFEEE